MLVEPTSVNGTSFHNVTIEVSPQQLIDLANKYNIRYQEQNTGEDKVNFDFIFQTEEGTVFTVYDWKYYSPIDLDSYYEFHIGAMNKLDSLRGLEQLEVELNNS